MRQNSDIAPQPDSSQAYSLQQARDRFCRYLSFFSLIALFQLIPSTAYAADALTITICTIVNWFTGSTGSAVATLGILVLGIGAVLGKVSWQMALIVTIGISIMFSGAQIVSGLTGETDALNVCSSVAGTSGSGVLESGLCTLAGLAHQTSGKAIGTIGIIILGISALMGKISTPMALILAVAIGLFFGAEDIVRSLATASGGTFQPCTPNAA